MKYLLIPLTMLIAITACQSNSANENVSKKEKDTANFTSIRWIDSLKNIDTVLPGTTAKISFRFLNSGDKPLYVLDAKPGCGCTIADYPKNAILPGKEGIIKAEYNIHKDGQGDFRKNIRVTTNTKGKTDNYIYFAGTIRGDSVNTNVHQSK